MEMPTTEIHIHRYLNVFMILVEMPPNTNNHIHFLKHWLVEMSKVPIVHSHSGYANNTVHIHIGKYFQRTMISGDVKSTFIVEMPRTHA